MRLWIPSWLFSGINCVLFVVICLLPLRISKGCGPYVNYNPSYSFIGNDIIGNTGKTAPFLLDMSNGYNFEHTVGKFFPSETEERANANVLDWQARVCDYAKLEDIHYFVYKTNVRELRATQTAIRNKKMPLPATLSKNTFADFLLANDCSETIDYLLYAKQCEPYVIALNPWETARKPDSKAMSELINTGLKLFRKTKSHYIKLRTAYQILRLLHYKQDYTGTLRYFDKLMPKIDDTDSVIYYWLLGHKAGALQGLGNRVEAAYWYGVIFKNCPSRRESAYRSFQIETDEEWNDCLVLCRDDAERAALYAMRASRFDSQAVTEMYNIYALDPQSPFLQTLLIREVRRLEQDLLGKIDGGIRRDQRKYHRKPRAARGEYVIELQAFARKCRQEKQVKNPSLWHILEGYLEFLAGDYYKAKQTFARAQPTIKNEALAQQLEAFIAVLDIACFKKITSSVEDSLHTISRNRTLHANYPDLKDYLNDKVAELYRKSDRPGLAFAAHYHVTDLRYNPDLRIIDDLLYTIGKDNEATRFERSFGIDSLGENMHNELINQKATYWMSRHQYRRALAILNKTDRANWDSFGKFTPFVERFHECVNCYDATSALVVDTGRVYNKGEIIEAILKAENEARLGGENADQRFYNIGLGIYNMTYFGQAWKATDFFRSGSSWASWQLDEPDGITKHADAPFGNRENFDVSIAESYFNEARFTALENGNRELAAKALFMMARCEQKKYFTSGEFKGSRTNKIPIIPHEYLTYFRRLEEEYHNTDFYPFIIEECKYFAAYTRQ